MKPAKTLTRMALLTATALALTACASGAPQSTEKPKDVDLRMTIWSASEPHLALFDSIAADYMAEHPEVKSITFDPLPFADYTATLTTQIAGGNAPDLAWVLENAALDFVSSGALLGLNETLENTEGFDLDDLSPNAIKLWKQDGELYGYPFSTSPFAVFANDDVLAEAGLPSSAELQDQGKWNWEDLADIGSQVNAKTGKAGIVIRDFDYQLWDYLSTIWNGWGASPWSDDGTSCEFDSKEMVKAFEFIHEAIFEKGALPGPGTSADFFAGEAAFIVAQISRTSALPEDPFAWNLLTLPEGPKGEYSVVGQGGIGVLAQGANTAVAADFLAFLTNPENSQKLSEFFPPPRESLLNAETLAKTNPLLNEAQLESVVVDAIANGKVRPSHVGSAEIAQQVRASLDAMWVADADVSAVLSDVCSSIEPLLEG